MLDCSSTAAAIVGILHRDGLNFLSGLSIFRGRLIIIIELIPTNFIENSWIFSLIGGIAIKRFVFGLCRVNECFIVDCSALGKLVERRMSVTQLIFLERFADTSEKGDRVRNFWTRRYLRSQILSYHLIDLIKYSASINFFAIIVEQRPL